MTKLYNSYSARKAIRYAKNTSDEIASSSAKLAGGKRITKAADDAAGLSISTKMNSEIKSKMMASRNTSDAFGVLHVMDGSIAEMGDMVIRLRELAINSASDTVSDVERDMMQTEVSALMSEITRISAGSNYLDNKLLQGDRKRLDIQVDAKSNSNNRISINLKDFAQSPDALGIGDVKIDTKHRARMALIKLDYAQGQLTESRARIGSITKRFESTVNKLANDVENTEAAKSRILDADYAKETADTAKNSIIAHSQRAVITQVNNQGRSYLRLLE